MDTEQTLIPRRISTVRRHRHSEQSAVELTFQASRNCSATDVPSLTSLNTIQARLQSLTYSFPRHYAVVWCSKVTMCRLCQVRGREICLCGAPNRMRRCRACLRGLHIPIPAPAVLGRDVTFTMTITITMQRNENQNMPTAFSHHSKAIVATMRHASKSR